MDKFNFKQKSDKLILNVDIILNNGTFDFKKSFLDSIICQTNHLKKNIKYEDDYLNKVETITAFNFIWFSFF